MNTVLKRGKMSFHLSNVTRFNHERCTSDLTNLQAMNALKTDRHVGGPETLNIVVVQSNEGPGVKGVCVLPTLGDDIGRYLGKTDGCVVAIDTVAGVKTREMQAPGNYGNGWTDFVKRFWRRQDGTIGPDDGARLDGSQNIITHEMGHWSGRRHLEGRNNPGGGEGNVMEPSSEYVPPSWPQRRPPRFQKDK